MSSKPVKPIPEHPENDLVDEADYSNRPRIYSDDIKSLADEPDPVVIREKNQKSSRQAVIYLAAVPLITFVSAYVLAWVSRLQGGPICEAGDAVWICSRAAELWWPIVTSLIAFGGMLGAAWILYDKYRKYLRWRAWMGVLWVLIPFSMLWATSVLPLAILGH
ncbi:hypothetical protein CDES_13500 [Corynebacterium deserti GIMN1.010]|uniref:Uncharacterized protein n=1 Tax=Corynebacterium deserti GIMN1.010 TaxID=931089 RepID=A0A0M4CS17_9CORY|nr:hypothetical protein [Corynebacterium deserti]ALC07030.1 hypothetical protein CDES_13500 [Corynebacterium deserti GIMN1.010]